MSDKLKSDIEPHTLNDPSGAAVAFELGKVAIKFGGKTWLFTGCILDAHCPRKIEFTEVATIQGEGEDDE